MRGDVYRLKRPRSAQGHEQQGERYAVVVQANAYEHLSTWLVAPTTTSPSIMIHPPSNYAARMSGCWSSRPPPSTRSASATSRPPKPGELMEINVALRAVLDLE